MLKQFFPFLTWIQNYKGNYFRNDIIAGATVGVLLIPQGMAYAMIAGLPPQYGLYAALIPQFIYALIGTSPVLAVGPVAMDSLLVASGLGALRIVGIENYIAAAVFLSFFMGIIQLTLGVLKMGVVVNFLSKPVINGFTSAAAIIIGVSQIKSFTGIAVVSEGTFVSKLISVFSLFETVHPITLLTGMISIVTILFLKKISKKLPSGLILIILSLLLSYFLNLEQSGVSVIGEIPKGLPDIGIPNIELEQVKQLFPIALTLALVAFMEAIAVSKSFEEQQSEYTVDSNQELVALGTANIMGSFFASYPTTGGFQEQR